LGKNNKKLTNDTFIIKANNVHNDKYNYTLINYINAQTKIKIICPEHGVFEQSPNNHLSGRKGYPYCGGTMKLDTNKFVEKSNIIHNNKYDYSLVDYKGCEIKVKIICSKHGIFEQIPIDHLYNKCGCPHCGGTMKSDTNKFIKKSNKIHNNKYDYSLVNYINKDKKVKIICSEHGIFEQIPNSHLKGHGCSLCNGGRLSTIGDFINKSKNVHNNKYDYTLVDYVNAQTKIKIICPKHGVFEQEANSHLMNHGCPLCQISKGEEKVKLFLEKNNIIYKKEHRFKNCRYKQPLKFDFYLPYYNMCIEYDGEQHFKKWNGNRDTDENFNIRKIRDQIKNDYCKNNNINLLRIKYDQFNKIDDILTEELKNNQLKYGFNTAL